MGTLLALSLPAGGERQQRWVEITFEVAAACERVMSRHDPDSDLSRVNRVAGRARLLRSPDLAATLRAARAWAERTHGGFDPTVAPLLDEWRRARRSGALPSRSRLHAARRRVGWQAIIVRGERVGLARRGATLDLGAFGKGAALDQIATTLRRERCGAALLNFGESSLAAIGRPRREPWGVLLRHPAGGFAGEFPLCDRACSPSSTLGQTWGRGRHRLSHVVDPRTGRPLRALAQVTVLARSAAKAEALSTALLVLGRAALAAAARRFGVDVCWIDAAGMWLSPRFPLTLA
jgi:thiamine biosynthesis lipoprotein